MKVLQAVTISVCWLSFVTANEVPKLNCDKVFNTIPNFQESCIHLYCHCVYPCFDQGGNMSLDVNGMPERKSEEYYEECFVNNGCELEKHQNYLTMCYTCIEIPPEELFNCAERIAIKQQ